MLQGPEHGQTQRQEPFPTANQRQREKVSGGKTGMRCLFLEFKDAPMQEADRVRNPAKGRATCFLLNWFGNFLVFFFFGLWK